MNFRYHKTRGKVASLPSLSAVEGSSPRGPPLFDEVWQWGLRTADYSSLHAVAWANRVDNPVLTVVIFALTAAVMVALPCVVVYQMALYANDTKVITAIEYRTAKTVEYPNITVCYPKYFDIRKFAKFNLSHGMADYLPMALDPSLGEYVDFMMRNPHGVNGLAFVNKMSDFERELDDVLSDHDLTLPDLFRELAIECDDFVFHCEYHRQTYVSGALEPPEFKGRHPTCCDAFFDRRPTFATTGTCFTTNATLSEHLPSTYSSLKIYVDARRDIAPVSDIQVSATSAPERSGIYWAVSGIDHPPSVMMTNPKRAAESTITVVGLKVVEGQSMCLESNNRTFEKDFGVKGTKLNCDGLILYQIYPNCSLAEIQGYLPHPAGLPTCLPKTMLMANSSSRAFTDQGMDALATSVCPYDCYRRDYELSYSTSAMDTHTLEEYVGDPSVLTALSVDKLDVSGITGLHFFFQTFSYQVNVLSQETWFDILSKIGGTMGLVIGASIFSFIEIIMFAGSLAKILLKRFVL